MNDIFAAVPTLSRTTESIPKRTQQQNPDMNMRNEEGKVSENLLIILFRLD
jgi:hypothetical protein